MFTIISTIDGHTVDTADTPAQAHDRSWWRANVLVVNNTTVRAFTTA